MTRQILIATDTEIRARWAAAFPDGSSVATAESARSCAAPDAIVWVLVESADPTSPARVNQVVRTLAPCRVVAISATPNDDDALACLGAGASGYAHAYASAPTLQQIAAVVANGGLWVGADLLKRLLAATQSALAPTAVADDHVLDALSEREREVARAVARGLSNKEVARELAITERTVKAHLGAVFAKLGARDRLHLALRMRGIPDTGQPGEGTGRMDVGER